MESKRVTSYQLAWNLELNVGSVRLELEGVEHPIERNVDATDFVALSTLLSSARADAPVVIAKGPTGHSLMLAGRKSIL